MKPIPLRTPLPSPLHNAPALLVWLVAALFLFLPSRADGGFVKIDDFDALVPGPIHGQNGWSSSTGAATVAADPTQAGNRVLRVDSVSQTVNVFKSALIHHPNTGTLFFRMMRSGKLNMSIGASDVASPNLQFANYAAQLNCVQDGSANLRVRDAGLFRSIETLASDEWLHVWMVIDSSANRYRVYLQRDPQVEPALLSSGGITDFTFRNSATVTHPNDIVNVLLMFSTGDGGHAGPFFVDDLFLDASGANLSDPVQPAEPDLDPPTLATVDPAPGTINTLTEISVTFSEPVLGLTASDLLINGTTALSVSGGGADYAFQIEQPVYGPVEIAWDPEHQITDLANPPNRFDGAGWQYELVDSIAPLVELINPPGGSHVRSFTSVEVTFDEPVQGVTAASLLINGTQALSATALDAGHYLFTFNEPAPGEVGLAWAEDHGISDLASIPNAFGGGSWSIQLNPDLNTSVRINEFLAGNRHGLQDEDGDASDWIELYNHGTAPINLAGWSLTDDSKVPGQWIFPSIVLDPGEYLIVFASGKDRRPDDGSPLHTNFRLGLEGEFLALYDSDSPRGLVSGFAPEFPQQRTDYSYGLDASGGLKYFESPTPGSANGDSAITAIVLEPVFSVQRGLFTAAFGLEIISPTSGAVIRYTLDGSEPTPASPQFSAPSLQVSGTTILRAAAFMDGALPSRPVTHTYVFPAQVIRQPAAPDGFPATWGTAPNFPGNIVPAHYEMHQPLVDHPDYAPDMEASMTSLPALSIVMDVDDMFGATQGIYTHSRENQNLFRGPEWERQASVELLPNADDAGFQVSCGIRIHGNASREPSKNPKHSFRLFFRRDYGPGQLKEKVYPESPVESFNQLVLRADFNNSWLHWAAVQRTRGTRIRDGWGKETWRDMGHEGSHSRYVNLFINGLYWGVYDIGERPDAGFASNYLGGEREDYDVMASKPTRATDGDRIAYDAMLQLVNTADMSLPASYQAVGQHLDLTNFIDYMLLNFFGGNQDWGFDSNWNALRHRSPEGRYKYYPWDSEHLLGDLNYNRVNMSSVPSGIHTKLVLNAEYRLAFADRVQKHMFNDGALTTAPSRTRWLKHAAGIEHAIIAESARWGNYRRDIHAYSGAPYEWYTPNTHWNQEIGRIADVYFPQRPAIFLQQLRNAGLFPNVEAPQLSAYGSLRRGDPVAISAPAGTIYYTIDGEDPKTFGGSAPAGTAIIYAGPIVIDSQVTLKARVLHNGEWSALTGSVLRVTAPQPHPLAQGPYYFGQWSADEPAGTYPPNLMFYQTQIQDPAHDVDMPELWTLPYDLVSRSRINGLGADGFAFINTGSIQDLDGAGYVGAAVVALDTTGQEDIHVNWTAGTVAVNPRIHGIRLQYRVGEDGEFTDLTDPDGNPVEYVASTEAGHLQAIIQVKLPAAAENQPLVELRWKYHYISGDSGARSQLRVGAILVSSGVPAAESLAFAAIPGSAQTGNSVGPIIVHVEVAPGIVAADYDGIVNLTIDGESEILQGTLSRPAIGGVAVFDDLTITGFGAKELTFTAQDVAGPISHLIRVVGLAEEVMPLFIQGAQPENDDRVPFAFRLHLQGLEPDRTYRYANRVALPGESLEQDGAGNVLFIKTDGTGYIRSTNTPRFRAEDLHLRHGEFVTDAAGSHRGWFITEPSGNARFTPGGDLHMRLLLNDGDGGESRFHTLTAPSPVRVLSFGSSPQQGSAVYGSSAAAPLNFILLYGGAEAGARPLAATPVESTGAEVDERYAQFYINEVAGRSGRWGAILPNALAGGVQRIEERTASGGGIVSSLDGTFHPTVYMSGGSPVGLLLPGPGGGGFQEWQARHFTLAQHSDDALSGPAASPMGDGIVNLLRYAFGLDLLDPAEPALPWAGLETIDGQLYLAFRHRRLTGDHGLVYRVEQSGDLLEWTDASSLLETPDIEQNAADGTETLRWLLPVEQEAGAFLRLRVDLANGDAE